MNVHSKASGAAWRLAGAPRCARRRTTHGPPRKTIVAHERLTPPLQEQAATRARLGVILPSVNTVVEPWFNAVAPAGVHVHATRMLLENDVTPEALRRMDEHEGIASALRLASCRPDVIGYGCTASSIVQGFAYDRHLREELERRTARRCITAVGAIIDALELLGARRIAVASPYSDIIDRAEHAFFQQAGFSVVGTANLGIGDGYALASPTPRDIYALATRALANDAEALVISCLNMNSQTVAAALEEATGVPVVTSTTATLWKLLRVAGIEDAVTGYGRLLAMR
jgi:maleate isomerase